MRNKKNHHAKAEEKTKIIKAYKNGSSVIELVKIFRHSRSSIYSWINEYSINKNFTRKNNPGSGNYSKITSEHTFELVRILKKPASMFGFETDLWNSKRLQIICKKNLQIKVSKMCIWRFLNKIKYSFKKVQKSYYEVDKKKQNTWLKETLPEIKRVIKKHNAILYFEDESNIQLSPVMGKSWGPIGKKIVHKVTGNKGSISAISAISNDGRLLFNLFDNGKRFNANDIISFLTRMLDHHPRRHLVVVMDRATCHKANSVMVDLQDQQKRLHLFLLPPKSPELNPDEQVWAQLKNHELKSHMKRTVKDLKALTNKKLRNISRSPQKIEKIFKGCKKSFLYL